MKGRGSPLVRLLAEVMAARARGDLPAASRHLDQARRIDVEHPDVLHLGAILAHEGGRASEAMRLIDKALARRHHDPALHRSRGLIAHAMGRNAEAVAALRIAFKANPGDAGLACQLAALLAGQGQEVQARAVLEAVPPRSRTRESEFERADLLRRRGDLEAAIAVYEPLLIAHPQDVAILVNLANCHARCGRPDDAERLFARALKLSVAPSDGARLAHAYAQFRQAQGDLKAATRFMETAVDLEPRNFACRRALAELLARDPERVNHGTWHITRAYELEPESPGIAELLAANSIARLCVSEDGAVAARAGREYGRYLARAEPEIAPACGFAGRADRSRRLRIGYLSADFRHHAVANFALPLLECHDRGRVEVFGYGDMRVSDDLTRSFERACDAWTDVHASTDAQIAARVCDDRIDVLVDLMGLTTHSRPQVFRRRPAPVQVTYLGYAGTTGLDCFDARLVDALTDPPGMTDDQFDEPLRRLPTPFVCYRPAHGDVECDVTPPAARLGVVTFGSFNNLAKVTRKMLRLWSEVLASVPNSRLLLKSLLAADPVIAADVRRMARETGIAAERLVLAPQNDAVADHLRAYGDVDIALDCFPYCGTTTTCEALWMGVPVVTLAGRTHVSRVGLSLLTHAGLGDLVAATPAEYVAICVRLAGDLPRLAAWRRGLRPQLAGSPLCDVPRLARAIEATYLDLWARWCDREAGRPRMPSQRPDGDEAVVPGAQSKDRRQV